MMNDHTSAKDGLNLTQMTTDLPQGCDIYELLDVSRELRGIGVQWGT